MDTATPPLIHEALLYRSPRALGERLTSFVHDARAAREPVLIVLPRPNLEAVRTELNGSGSAPGVQFAEMSEVGHNPCCLLSIYQDWIDSHDGPVRMIGELIWPGRTYAESVECLRHEALVNLELERAEATILCPYDAEHLDASLLAGAELTHRGLIDDSGVRRESAGFGDPLEVGTGIRWPQAAPLEPVSEHVFAGDLRSLRRAVDGDAMTAGLSATRRADLVFAVNEAATNALCHADGSAVVRLWRDPPGVVAEVVTESELADTFAGRRRPSAESLNGRGLWLINQVCDLAELRSGEGRTVLRMHLRDTVR